MDASKRSRRLPRPPRPRRPLPARTLAPWLDRHATVCALAVLMVGIVLSTSAARYTDTVGRRQAQDVLDRRSAVATWALRSEVARYQDSVSELAAAVTAQQDFTDVDFAAMADPLVRARLSGASGVAFVASCSTGDVAATSAFWRARGGPALVPDPAAPSWGHAFVVFQVVLDSARDPGAASGAARAASVRGHDLAGVPAAATALERARASGQDTVSGSFTLLRDRALPAARRQSAVLLVAPVRGPAGTADAAQLRGWVVLGLRLGDLARGTLRDAAQGLVNATLDVDDGAGRAHRVVSVDNGAPSGATVPRRSRLHVGDQTWTLTTSSTRAGDALNASYTRLGRVLGVGGCLLSVLLAALGWFLVRSRRTAHAQVLAATGVLREAEEAARRHAGLLDAVVESIGDGVSVVDAHGDVIVHNSAARALLGRPDEAPQAFLPDGTTPFPPQQMPLVRALRGEGTDGADLVIRHAGRHDAVAVTVTGRPLSEASGLAGGGVAVFHDVSAARELARRVAAQHADQERLLTALAGLGESLVMVTDGALTYVNTAFAELVGAPRDALVGTPLVEVAADAASRQVVARVAADVAADDGGSPAVGMRLRRRDGRVVDVEVAAIATQDGPGSHSVWVLRDVTDALRTRADLAASREVFEAAFDDALVGMGLIGLDGRFERVNTVLAAMTGRTVDALVGCSLADVVHSDDAGRTRQRLDEVLAAGRGVVRQALRLVRPDGGLVHAEASASLLRDADGQPLHYSVQLVDVTDRLQAERQRDAQQRVLRGVLDNSQSIIYAKDLAGRYLLANALLQERLGRGEAEILGLTDADLHRVVDPSWAQRDARAREGLVHHDDVIVRGDGSTTVYESVRFPLVDEAGVLYGTCGLSVDVTARRQMAAEREAATAALAAAAVEAAEAKAHFFATMSHEIRTPLNGVLGLLSVLEASDLDATQRAWAAAAARSGHALLCIVNDVLDASKVQAGAVQLESVPVDVLGVVQDALAPLRLDAGDKGLDIVVAPARAFGALRLGDPTRLRQVVTNLVANAVKFTEQGTVTVTLGGDATRLRLTVTDTGIGMDAAQQARLFEPYTQADASTTRRYGGTGLGLAIVHGLVEHMDGTIGVHSAPGMGTSFHVELPLPAVSTPPPARRPDGEACAVRPGLRLLVAEDNEVNQLVARAALERFGLHVDVVADGAAALAAVRAIAYDAVFMDCRMPGVDGLEATRRLRAAEAAGAARRRRLPVIAMTASAFDADRQECRDAGMDDFLPKPWTAEQLLGALRVVEAALDDPAPATR